MAKVLVAGATGNLGSTIAEQLARARVQTAARVRGLSKATTDPKRKDKIDRLAAAGVTILEGDSDNVDAIAEQLKSFDTIISTLSGPDMKQGELALVKAAQKAGTIKLFIPSQFGGEYARTGPLSELYTQPLRNFQQGKDEVLDAIRSAGIPFIKVIANSLFSFMLPAFGSLSAPNTPSPSEAKIYGDGTKQGSLVSEADIGKVLAQAVNDPRVINKRLIIRANTMTQKELVAAYTQATGKQVSLRSVSAEELDAAIEGALPFPAFLQAAQKAIWVHGLYTTEIPTSKLIPEAAMYAHNLYPHMSFATPQDYYQSQV